MKKILMTTLLFLFSTTLLKAAQEPIDLSSILNDQEELLKVEEAFQLSVDIVDDKALIKFDIADGYYMYSERLNVSSPDAKLGKVYIPEGKEKDDPYLGLTQVHYHFLESSAEILQANGDFTLIVGYQGCAEDRLCYPPTTQEVNLSHNVGMVSASPSKSDQSTAQAERIKEVEATHPAFVSEQQKHTEHLTEESLISNFFYFLLLGLALTFTPCVFPMIPIISGIIAGQGDNITTRKAFFLSLTYTQAMAIVYTILGIVVALAGQSISGYFQSPGVVITAAAIFALLSLSMFGFYELQLPSSLQAKLSEKSNQQKKGSYLGTGIMGAISALIVSPCVTVPLIAILLVIAQSGDVLLGGISLYGLGVGMGIPLIIIGVTGGKFLPKAGPWMNGIKAAFGVAMLGVALYLVKHLLPSSLYMYGWGILAIIPGFFLLNNKLGHHGWKTFIRSLGLVAILYGALLVIGGAQGQRNLMQPLDRISQNKSEIKSTGNAVQSGHLEFKRIKSLNDLNREVKAANDNGKTVMLDLFAKWCAACYEFEEKVFTDANVIEALSNTVLLQADVTDNDATDVELMQAYDVLGLPSIMFFDANGNELSSFRATGFEDAESFEKRINAAFKL